MFRGVKVRLRSSRFVILEQASPLGKATIIYLRAEASIEYMASCCPGIVQETPCPGSEKQIGVVSRSKSIGLKMVEMQVRSL